MKFQYDLLEENSWILDIECIGSPTAEDGDTAPYVLFLFTHLHTGEEVKFEIWKRTNTIRTKFLKWFVKVLDKPNVVLYTTNGRGYDIPMMQLALYELTNEKKDKKVRFPRFEDFKELSDNIVNLGNDFQIPRHIRKMEYHFQHRDTQELGNMNVPESIEGERAKRYVSLKEAAANTGFSKVLDLVVDPDFNITSQEKKAVYEYCGWDHKATRHIAGFLIPDIELRRWLMDKYDLSDRLLGLGEPRVAKASLVAAYKKKTGNDAYRLADDYWNKFLAHQIKKGKYKPTGPIEDHRAVCESLVYYDFSKMIPGPNHFKFFNSAAEKMYNAMRSFRRYHWEKDKEGNFRKFEYMLDLNGFKVKIAEGGIHDHNDNPGEWNSNSLVTMYQLDGASYYPYILDRLNLHPVFLPGMKETFWELVEDRLELKANCDKFGSNSMKIMINSVYGQMSSRYSPFWYPWGGKSVPLTGQLYFVQLIDWLQKINIETISCNTDGIFVMVKKEQEEKFRQVVDYFSKVFNLVMDIDELGTFVKRNVNSYLMLDREGKVIKGVKDFRYDMKLKSTLKGPIIAKALVKYYQDRTPVEKTIMECDDIRDFVFTKSVSKRSNNVFIEMPWAQEPTQLQNTQRWYVSYPGLGGKIYSKTKIHGRSTAYNKEAYLLPLLDYNDMPPFDQIPLNKKWYVEKAESLIV